MWIFLKTQVSSLIATGMDFLMTILLVEVGKLHYIEATLTGAVTGAFTNFFINKYWSFQHSGPLRQQGAKYFMVWLGSVMLNTLGIYVLTGFAKISYIVSKLLISIVVGIAFNYTLQRHYVFAKHEKVLSK